MIGCLLKLQAETTMTTKLGRSLPISCAACRVRHFVRQALYLAQRAPRSHKGSEKSSENNSFSECIVPLPCSDS